jgi:predicted DNA-binding protein with PD1-like motif
MKAHWLLNLFCYALLQIQLCRSASEISSSADDLWLAQKQLKHEASAFSSGKFHVIRLSPNEDLIESMWKYARALNIKAASIVSVVGSLSQVSLRYANQENTNMSNGHFEIVSVVGNIDYQNTLSSDYSGSGHIHLSCADEQGRTIGGHAMSGNLVYTTAEITILEIVGAVFIRTIDDDVGGSGYYELKVIDAVLSNETVTV